jgi:hypothetical protein
MRKVGLLGLATLIAVVAVGGIGFAQFTTSAYLSGNASAGTLGPLTWSNVGETTLSSTYVTCTVTIGTTTNTSDTLEVTVGNLAPGDYCMFSADLNNGGSIPANVYAEVTCYTQTLGGCTQTSLYDNFAPSGAGESYNVIYGPITVTSSTPLAYSGEIQLSPGIGNAYQGATCVFTVTFSATAGT